MSSCIQCCVLLSVVAISNCLNSAAWKPKAVTSPELQASAPHPVENDRDGFNLEEDVDDLANQFEVPEIVCDGKVYSNLPLAAKVGDDGIWCPVQKSATSTIYHTADHHGRAYESDYIESFHDLIKRGKKNDVCTVLGKNKSWVIMRDPWDRIRSCYLDKVVEPPHKIKVPGHSDPSFLNFLQYLAKLDPLDVNAWNPHARPVSLTCQTTGSGAFHYERVIKLDDNFERNLTSALRWSGLDIPGVYSAHTNNAEVFHTNHNEYFHLSKFAFYNQHGGQAAIDLVRRIYADDIAFGNFTYWDRGAESEQSETSHPTGGEWWHEKQKEGLR